MTKQFEDHCWKDVVPADILDLYSHYSRDVFVGPNPALLAIDLYELAYQGGPQPVSEVSKTYPSSCGAFAWEAIAPTERLFAASRAAGIPVFYSTGDLRPDNGSEVKATKRRASSRDPAAYAIRPEFAPQPGDVVIRKMRASVFFGTPLIAQLVQRGVQSVIICGESTSGCVRATAVEAYSYGLHVTLVEECCFDRNLLAHKFNLFDMHHKYADVLDIDTVVGHLETLARKVG
ncbi:MAG: isochorismatase hydrolase [Herminiimonas sp.]|nr:isochorismatase hydrolase [Herminiimonas sp.]